MIKLILPGDPTPQARIRVFKRGNRVMTYDPQTALKKDLKVKVAEQLEGKDWPMPKNPQVTFWFYMPIPKSMSKSERIHAQSGYLKHVKKPDVDNLIKLYLDVLTGIAIEDDNCVSIAQAIKIYSPLPKTVIIIKETDKLLSNQELLG